MGSPDPQLAVLDLGLRDRPRESAAQLLCRLERQLDRSASGARRRP